MTLNPATKKTLVLVALLALVFAQTAQAALVPASCQRAAAANACTLPTLVTLAINIINFLIASAGIVTLLFMVFGGVQMLVSGGQPERIKAGRTTMVNALVGFLIVMTAFIVISLVVNRLSGGNINNIQNIQNFIT